MRWLALVAMILGVAPATAQQWDQNTKCEAACRSNLDQCAAVSNKTMETAIKETLPYRIETPERRRADIKFESAFQTAEKCWDKYYRCAGNCRPPKTCTDACQSSFKLCFAAGERTMKEGLRAMKSLKFGSDEWKAAYGRGDMPADRCLEENRNCHMKCANP
jgi:hypothetical protein